MVLNQVKGKNFISQDFFQINSQLFITETGPEHSIDWSHQIGLIPTDYSVKDCYEVKYVNFGLATSRRKNDCSKDLSVARVAQSLNQQGEDGLPEQLFRIASWPRIYSDYMRGLTSPLRERAKSLWIKHQSKLLTYHDVHLPVRIPGIDFEECDPKDWEGRFLIPALNADLSLMTKGRFDNLSHLLKVDFDDSDLLRSQRLIRSFKKKSSEEFALNTHLSEFATAELLYNTHMACDIQTLQLDYGSGEYQNNTHRATILVPPSSSNPSIASGLSLRVAKPRVSFLH